jgi:hypothetical protein
MYYSGVFFDGPFELFLRDKATSSLAKPVEDLHVTFHFNPKEDEKLPKGLIGKEVTIKVVGEGNDGKNHGFEVELPNIIIENNGDKVNLKSLYKNTATPHITMSLAPGGKAVDTKNLEFSKIEPFEVVGKLGYWENGKLVF